MELELPADLAREVEELVALGEFPSREAAVVELARLGLAYRYRRAQAPRSLVVQPPGPSGPAPSPGPGLPGDVNWIP